MPSTTAIFDATLDSANPTLNNGADVATVISYTTASGRVRRTIIGFDLSSHPAVASAATLSFYVTSVVTPAQTINVRPLQTDDGPIVESEATWNKRNASTDWGNIGGEDYWSLPVGDTAFAIPGGAQLINLDVLSSYSAAKTAGLTNIYYLFILSLEIGLNQNCTLATKENMSGFPVPTLTTVAAPGAMSHSFHRQRRRGLKIA